MDLSSVNININRLLTNIWNIVSFFKEFAVDDSKDVSVTYINEDGSESSRTFPNISKQIYLLDNWKVRFLTYPVFMSPGRQGRVYKRIGEIRIDNSPDYFNTGIGVGNRFTGFSLKIHMLYENDSSDHYNSGMAGYASGYVGEEEIATNIYGNPNLKCKVDADGRIWIANINPSPANTAFLYYDIECIRK